MLRRLALAAALAVTLAVPAWAERIDIKTLQGKVIPIEIGLGETVEALIQQIADKEGIPADQQRLIFAGKQLDPSLKLSDYNLTQGATVMLIPRIRSQ
jgi:hypothetical protein